LNKVIESNPGVKHAKNLLRMQKASLTILRKESGPVLSIGGSYSYMTDIENLEKYRNTLSFSLGLQGNFFDGGKDSGTMASGKALYKQLEADLSIKIINLKRQIKTLTDSIDRSSKLIELYSFQERASRYEFEKGLKDLELGQITEKELSELQINLENIRLSRQQNIINTNMLYLQLVNLQGVDLLNHPMVRNNR